MKRILKILQTKLLNEEVDRLRAESIDSEDLRKKNEELEKFLLENETLLEEHRLQIAELRSCVASYERTVQLMKVTLFRCYEVR